MDLPEILGRPTEPRLPSWNLPDFPARISKARHPLMDTSTEEGNSTDSTSGPNSVDRPYQTAPIKISIHTLASRMRNITTPGIDSTHLPPGATEASLPVSMEDIATFNDILSDEIDSSFSSSICCCDDCFDDFAKHWPGIINRRMDFQTSSIDMDDYLDSSRIRDIYSEGEFSTLRHFAQCTRCGSFGACNFWIYEHTFNNSDEVERQIAETAVLAAHTPFLLLENEFARKVRDRISQLRPVSNKVMDRPLYRARDALGLARLGQDPKDLQTFSPPPGRLVTEGRFNHAGHPMLYAATSQKTALAEVGKTGQEYVVAQLNPIGHLLAILDLEEISEDGEEDDVPKAVAQSILVASPARNEGWRKPEYAFSRFIADCAIADGFDAIRYGSTREAEGCNIVYLSPPPDVSEIVGFVSSKRFIYGEPPVGPLGATLSNSEELPAP